jgi:hypothetical protein
MWYINKFQHLTHSIAKKLQWPSINSFSVGQQVCKQICRETKPKDIIRIIKSRRMRWGEHVVRMEKRNVYRLLAEKPEGKRPLGRPRCKWIENIKMGLLERGLNVVDWIGLAQDRYR